MPSIPFDDLPLFQCLSSADRRELEKHTIEHPYRKNDFIFKEGDAAEWFHIVKEGTVKCVKSSPEGREITLKVLMPGDLFCCETSAMNGRDHPGCAQAMDNATILKLDRKVVLEMVQKNPETAMHIISYLSDRLREAQENAKAFALDSAEKRLAGVLVGLAQRAGVDDPDGRRLNVKLTRQDLADMAGLTLETTSRIMSRLTKANCLAGTARRIVIRDLPHLQALADETPS